MQICPALITFRYPGQVILLLLRRLAIPTDTLLRAVHPDSQGKLGLVLPEFQVLVPLLLGFECSRVLGIQVLASMTGTLNSWFCRI